MVNNKDIILQSRKLIHRGSILDYYQDDMKFSNGNTETWDFIDHKPVVAIVPVDRDGKIICVRQYRHAVNKYTIEIPAGGIGVDKEPLTGALRELKEETGYECNIDEVKHLIDIYTSVGFCNEKIYIYEGKVVRKGDTHPDENEFVRVKKYSVSELKQMVFEGIIDDSKTVSAIMTYALKHSL